MPILKKANEYFLSTAQTNHPIFLRVKNKVYIMMKYFENLAKAMFGVKFHELGDQEQKVIESIANKEPLPENINFDQ